MVYSLPKALLLASILATFANADFPAFTQIQPYTDAQCTDPADYEFENDVFNVGTPNENKFTLGFGVDAPDRGNKWQRYKNVNFKNTSAPANGIGDWVYWDVGDVGHDCNHVIMLPYAGNVGHGAMAFDQPPGNVIVAANKRGCHFTQIPASTTLYTTFCCGSQCQHFVGDSPDGRKTDKRSEELVTEPVVKPRTVEVPMKKDVTALLDLPTRHTGSLAARAAALTSPNPASLQRREQCRSDDEACMEKVWASCQIDKGESSATAGLQVAVSNIQKATAGPGVGSSSISASRSFTIGTSFSSSVGESTSIGVGVSVGITAGVAFPVEATSTVTLSSSFTKEFNKQTTNESNESKQTSVTYTSSMVPGTQGFLSFTPYYNCYSPTIQCGESKMWGYFSICYPQLGNDGAVKGEYSIVIV
ncbi:hypothetical protein BJ875DRAFT_440604 [Amylocarpus encephaloides]|uniref:Uncharacterized protein n=1 Tax=Amylocarpus encephaloides TaxID=45428 RepID=A0A9P7YKE2_9HELO|nr:hypothetical protein BJ875DRAFT_440604 [Amylocarpus encephaloides]